MYLGTNLQYLRKQNNILTQEQLAEKMRVSRQTVSKWESGETIPELSKLMELSDLFSCTLDTLIREDLTRKNSIFHPVRIERVAGFPYACYPMISKNPREDSRNALEARLVKAGLAYENLVQIGWGFPYLSQEQKQRFDLQGYVSAVVLPKECNIEDNSLDIQTQEAADYAVLTVQNPDTNQRASRAYEIIFEYLKANGIQKQHNPQILPCFERTYQVNGIPYMDVYVHCAGNNQENTITLHI